MSDNYPDILSEEKLSLFFKTFLTAERKERYNISDIDKTNLCRPDNKSGGLVPFIEIFVSSKPGEISENDLKTEFLSGYRQAFGEISPPGVNIRSIGKWLQEYAGHYYHLCSVRSTKDIYYNDYEIYELNAQQYENVLAHRYAYCKGSCDSVLVRHVSCTLESDRELFDMIMKYGLTADVLRGILG